MKILPTPKHPQSSAGAVGDAGAQTGEPDVQVCLGPQVAEGAQGPGGRQEQGWVVEGAAEPWGTCFSPRPAPSKPGPGVVLIGAWGQLCVPMAPAPIARGLYLCPWAGVGVLAPC